MSREAENLTDHITLPYNQVKIIMDKKLTKSTKIQSPHNKQTYPTVQTVTDNTIKHKNTL